MTVDLTLAELKARVKKLEAFMYREQGREFVENGSTYKDMYEQAVKENEDLAKELIRTAERLSGARKEIDALQHNRQKIPKVYRVLRRDKLFDRVENIISVELTYAGYEIIIAGE